MDNNYILGCVDIEELCEICKELNIAIPRPRNRTNLRSVIIQRLKEKEWYQNKLIDCNPLNKYHRGFVDYTLPWVLISKILTIAYRISDECICVKGTVNGCIMHYTTCNYAPSKSTEHLNSYEKYKLEQMKPKKFYTPWRMHLSLVSKQVYQLFSNRMFNKLTLRSLDQVQNLWRSAEKEWSVIKRLEKIQVRLDKLDDLLIDNHLVESTFRDLVSFRSLSASFTLVHLQKMIRLMPNLTSICITMPVSISKTMGNLLFQDSTTVFPNLVDLEFGSYVTLPFTDFSLVTRKNIRKLVIGQERLEEMLRDLPQVLKDTLQVTSVSNEQTVELVKKFYPNIRTLYLLNQRYRASYWGQSMETESDDGASTSVFHWPSNLDTIYICGGTTFWLPYIATMPKIKKIKDHHSMFTTNWTIPSENAISVFPPTTHIPYLETYVVNLSTALLKNLEILPGYNVQSTRFIDNHAHFMGTYSRVTFNKFK